MSISFNEMRDAVNDARATIRRTDAFVAEMANMIAGRLKTANVPRCVLKELKKELANYNMHTGEWK